jgi:hypothetical protein
MTRFRQRMVPVRTCYWTTSFVLAVEVAVPLVHVTATGELPFVMYRPMCYEFLPAHIVFLVPGPRTPSAHPPGA